MFCQELEFEGLDFAKSRLTLGVTAFATIDKSEGVLLLAQASGQSGEARMMADATKPIFGI